MHITPLILTFFFFFFNDTATTEIYTLSLHDALPISHRFRDQRRIRGDFLRMALCVMILGVDRKGQRSDRVQHRLRQRSEEHTSELQSRLHLVCRLLLEKKKN